MRQFTETDFQQLDRFGHPELVRLHHWLSRRLQRPFTKPYVLAVRLVPELAEHLRVLAVRRGLTISDLTRAALSDFVARNPMQ